MGYRFMATFFVLGFFMLFSHVDKVYSSWYPYLLALTIVSFLAMLCFLESSTYAYQELEPYRKFNGMDAIQNLTEKLDKHHDLQDIFYQSYGVRGYLLETEYGYLYDTIRDRDEFAQKEAVQNKIQEWCTVTQ